ncbi:MAG: hypothetical protein ABI779_12130 [Acidobacteriota bacterium]
MIGRTDVRRLLITLLLYIFGIPTHADEPITYTRFLVPLYTQDVPGAYGSVWQVRTWLHYSGNTTTLVAPTPFCFYFECTVEGPVEPGWPAVPLEPMPDHHESAILVHVDSRLATAFTFNSRVRDASRQGDTAGAEVPVIREDRIRNASVYLLNVPRDDQYRAMLRVYALPDVETAEVEVRYYRQPDAEDRSKFSLDLVLLRADRIKLRLQHDPGRYQFSPAIAEIANVERLPELRSERLIWIEIKPLTPNLRIWSFISLTNNETQHVTTITPGV